MLTQAGRPESLAFGAMLATCLRWIVDANIKLSCSTAEALGSPTDKTFWRAFESRVQSDIRALPDGATVVDVGGGRRCVYHHALRPALNLVAVDISAEELALNEHANEIVVADVSRELPLRSGSADLIVSRAVLEHVPDVAAAATNMVAALKPGGKTLHFLPCRYSLFAIAARIAVQAADPTAPHSPAEDGVAGRIRRVLRPGHTRGDATDLHRRWVPRRER